MDNNPFPDMTNNNKITWPDNKAFAFSIFDDCDSQNLSDNRRIFDFLSDLGIRASKSVWMHEGSGDFTPKNPGITCQNPKYVDWLVELEKTGFEISFHNATYHSSLREDTIRALDTFKDKFGHDPKVMANHLGNIDGMYYGPARLSNSKQRIRNLLVGNRGAPATEGHVPGSRFFWGDVCKARIKYVRNFTYKTINTLEACPYMPYHDPQREFVNYWFAASEGPSRQDFNRMLVEPQQDKLALSGGACLIYTHFGFNFIQDGKLEPRFRELMIRISKMNGWFVPVGTLLDYLLEKKGTHTLNNQERSLIENKWALEKVKGFAKSKTNKLVPKWLKK